MSYEGFQRKSKWKNKYERGGIKGRYQRRIYYILKKVDEVKKRVKI